MTIVHWQGGQMSTIPGTWLLFYGCALISASVSTMPLVAKLGIACAALGLVALLLPAIPAIQMTLLGLGFGGLHLLFGFLIGRSSRDNQN